MAVCLLSKTFTRICIRAIRAESATCSRMESAVYICVLRICTRSFLCGPPIFLCASVEDSQVHACPRVGGTL